MSQLTRKTQLQRIIDILEAEGQIDNFACVDSHFTLRLAMHIGVLRKRGWDIQTKELDNKNCIYKLVAAPKPQQLTLA